MVIFHSYVGLPEGNLAGSKRNMRYTHFRSTQATQSCSARMLFHAIPYPSVDPLIECLTGLSHHNPYLHSRLNMIKSCSDNNVMIFGRLWIVRWSHRIQTETCQKDLERRDHQIQKNHLKDDHKTHQWNQFPFHTFLLIKLPCWLRNNNGCATRARTIDHVIISHTHMYGTKLSKPPVLWANNLGNPVIP